MKTRLLLCALGAFAFAQEAPVPTAIEGVRGVRQEGSGKVKEIDPAAKNVAPATAQGVDKVDGVKAPGGAKSVKETPPPASVTEGAKPVEGAGTRATPPPPAPKGVEAVKGVKPPEAVKGAGTKATPPPPPAKGLAGAEGVKPPEGVKGAGTKGTPPPPAPKGVEAVKGVKPPEAVKGAGAKGTPPPPAKGLEGVKGVKPPEGVKPAAGGVKPVEGVTGIGAAKQQNLEAALKAEGGKPEPKKAKAAAALLGGPEPKGKPEKPDDRKLFEENKKIPDNGS